MEQPSTMDDLDERGGWLSRFTRPVEQTPEQRGEPLRGESFRSYASVAAYLPPQRPYLRRLKLIVALMALASALNTVASSWLASSALMMASSGLPSESPSI